MLIAGVPSERVESFLFYGVIYLGLLTSALIFGASIFVRALQKSNAAAEALEQREAELRQGETIASGLMRGNDDSTIANAAHSTLET